MEYLCSHSLSAEGLNWVESILINKSTLANKRCSGIMISTIITATFACDALVNFDNHVCADAHDGIEASNKQLAIISSYNLSIAEVSGLARIRAPIMNAGKSGDSIDLYAVGDASYEVARFRMGNMNDASNAGQQPDIRIQNVAHALGKHEGNASQWEAVAVDGKESVCIQRRAGCLKV